jgi:predicted metal-dependent peptidase
VNINQAALSDYDKKLITDKYEEILGYIEYILIDSTSYLKMFGYFYMCLDKKLIFVEDVKFYKEIQNVEAGLVFIDEKALTFIIDPMILFDEKAIFKLLFKIVHEILHAMLKHNSRKPSDIKDALIFNLAADQLVNSIILKLYKNSMISKVAYFSNKEFYIERLEKITNNDSVEHLFDHILNCNEFEIAAKKISISIGENSQSSMVVEDIIHKSDLVKLEEKLTNELDTSLKNLSDPEFNLNPYLNKTNAPVDEDLYIKKVSSALFKQNDTDTKTTYESDTELSNYIDSTSSQGDELNSQEVDLSNVQFVDMISFIIIHVFDKITKKSYQVIYDLENQSMGSETIEREAPTTYEKYKDEFEQALSNGKQKGDTKGSGLSIFEKIFKVEYPWDEVLQNAILTKSQKSEERSFTEYDIYRNHICKVRFPGCMTELTPEVLCGVIDASCSMTDDDLTKILSILCDSVGKYSDIIVFVHDTVVHDTIYIKDINSKDEIFEKLKQIKGRGGTSHKDAFEKVQELSDTNIISTLLFFTDFESDVKTYCTEYPVLNHLESIWCIFNRGKQFIVDLPIPTHTINIENINFK